MASRKLSDLDPAVRDKCISHLRLCRTAGIDVLVTCTWRSNEEQASLYARGRTVLGTIVTNASPGESNHNVMKDDLPAARAYDVVPLRDGKPVWDADDPLWERIGKLGEEVGMRWAGRWIRFKEFPHFEV